MRVKRASKQVEHLGMEIQKGLYGFYPASVPHKNEKAKVFNRYQEAVDAVLGGYRPINQEAA